MSRYLPFGLLASAIVFGLMAGAIALVSSAHGHGLASADRQAIVMLTVAAVVCLAGSAIGFRRRRG